MKLTVKVTVEPRRAPPCLLIAISEGEKPISECQIPLDALQQAINEARQSSPLPFVGGIPILGKGN